MTSSQVLLPPERFFWAVLDASVLPRRITDPKRQLGYLFEGVLPISIESVQAVYARIHGTRQFVGCGIERKNLQVVLGEQPKDLVHFGPESLPNFVLEQVQGDAIAPESF